VTFDGHGFVSQGSPLQRRIVEVEYTIAARQQVELAGEEQPPGWARRGLMAATGPYRAAPIGRAPEPRLVAAGCSAVAEGCGSRHIRVTVPSVIRSRPSSPIVRPASDKCWSQRGVPAPTLTAVHHPLLSST
jgi:hypothetical protein